MGVKGVAYWHAVWKVAPWDEYQHERRHGEAMAALAAANGAKRVTPRMFMRYWIGPDK